jgi:hypothetical protein
MQNQTQPLATISESLEREGYQLTPATRAWLAQVESNVPPEVVSKLVRRDGAAQLVELLPKIIPLTDVARPEGEGVWQYCGYFYYNLQRYNEALGVFSAMYDQMLASAPNENSHSQRHVLGTNE